MAAEFTVSAEVPLEARVTVFVDGVFSVTLPKARLAALTVNCGFAAATPVPRNATVVVLPGGGSCR